MSIQADQVKKLRDKTGAGMMDCKKALVETNGDFEAAIEILRIKGQAKAVNKADRIAAEGQIAVRCTEDGKAGIIVEVNSETDFVAKHEDFLAFITDLTEMGLKERSKDVDSLLQLSSNHSETFEQRRQHLVAKLGENIHVRRLQLVETDGMVGSYLHGSRIGVLVQLDKAKTAEFAQLAKDIAMHIAASNPLVIDPNSVPEEYLNKEREIFSAQAETSGKPKEIIAKMVEGRIKKYQDEVSLLRQPFVKDPSITVGDLLNRSGAHITGFIRYEVGEGIEKQVVNFAQEVMAQIKQ